MEDYNEDIIGGISAGMSVVGLIVAIIYLASLWRIFEKAGRQGWEAIIPIYNLYVMIRIVGKPGWWLLLYLVPIVNIVISVIVIHNLSKSFGKDVAYTIGLILLGFIFYPLLGFGSAEYVGPGGMPSEDAGQQYV